MALRVLVCGGRDFADKRLLFETLSWLHDREPFAVLIHGAARGADQLAQQWAQANGIEDWPFPADWDRHGKAGGYFRNACMLFEGKPDLIIAFAGGRGTAMMCDLANKAAVPIIKV